MKHGHDALVLAPTNDKPAIDPHVGEMFVVPSVAAPGRKEYRYAFPIGFVS